MSNISGKHNLLNLKCSVKIMKGETGDMECLVIPIKINNLFKGDKGIYLDWIGFEIKNKKEGQRDTHLIKQSLSKEVRGAMSKEEINAMPIIGNAQVWGENFEPETVSDPTPQNEEENLPF